MSDEPKTFTQDEVDALIAERLDKELGGLKTNQAKALDQAKKAQDRAQKAEARAVELEQERKALEGGVTAEKLAQIRADADKAHSPVYAERDQLKSRLREKMLDSSIQAEMLAGGARGERVKDLFKLTADRYDLADDDTPIVKDHASLPLKKYVTETLKAEYPEFFQGIGSSGGGATKANARGAAAGRTIPASQTQWSNDDIADIATGKASAEMPE